MIHKISEFCDKVDSIKSMADRLRNMKYGPVKASDSEINHTIETIQHQCYMVSQDKGTYEKNNYGDYSGINHDGMLNNEKK